jgi:ABC-type sugar transport system ATPase subunit
LTRSEALIREAQIKAMPRSKKEEIIFNKMRPFLITPLYKDKEISAKLRVTDICLNFGGVAALSGVSFDVREGEMLAVIGPNGAGKTTLILSLIGIIPQRLPGRYKGEVRVKGMSSDSTPISEITKYVGAVFQDPENQSNRQKNRNH